MDKLIPALVAAAFGASFGLFCWVMVKIAAGEIPARRR